MNKKIYNLLRDRIIYLDYEPGQIIKEQEIAKEFGVSQTPLKTIFARLAWERLVRILPRTGIMIIELELNALTKVYQARIELEFVIGSMAAQNFTGQHFKQLDALIAEFDQQIDKKNPRKLAGLDIRIKQFFNDVADNSYLTRMAHQLYTLTLRLWYFNLLKSDLEQWNAEVLSMKKELISLSVKLKDESPQTVGKEKKLQLVNHIDCIRSQFLKFSDILYH
jgi:DNA-binding GntR family transcriptional regulator